MLHGYENGHNYIMGSIYLSSVKDMDTIATLSDWTEYVNNKDDGSYLSAYPLEESGYYVIARTWYAEEMKRPGCVWTHSILIPINALRVIEDYRKIETLFRKPKHNDYDSYNPIINYDGNQEDEGIHLDVLASSVGIPSIIRQIIHNNGPSLYEIEVSSETYRYLCLMLMNIIPSSLLAKTSFCSGTNGVRLINGKPFDVQFTQLQHHSVKSLFEGSNETINPYSYIATYIQGEVLSLSRLIRMFEDEIDSDAIKYETLCTLIALLNTKEQNEENRQHIYSTIVDLVAQNFPNSRDGALIKQNFFSYRISSLFIDDHKYLKLFCSMKNSSFVKPEYLQLRERIESIKKDPYKLFVLLSDLLESPYINELGVSLLSDADRFLTETDIVELQNTKWYTYLSLVYICPVLLNKGSWKTISKNQLIELLPVYREVNVVKHFNLWDDLLNHLLKQCVDTDYFTASLLYMKCKDYVKSLLNQYNYSTETWGLKNLLNICSNHPKDIIDWLKDKHNISDNVRLFICKSVNPISSEAKSISAENWCSMLNCNVEMPLEYYVFIYLLSFNWDKNIFAMDFLRCSFYPLHKAISEGRLNESIWDRLLPFTEPLPIWQSWDKCKKLRKMMVKRVKQAGLYEDYLLTCTPDSELNKQLMNMW